MNIEREQLLKGKFLVPALVACWALIAGNAIVFPTALVMTLACLMVLIDSTGGEKMMTLPGPLGIAGRPALFTFSAFIAISNIVVSLFLPGYAGAGNLNGLSGGDFVQVTVNYFHGFAYMTAFLLLTCMAFIVYFRWQQSRHVPSGIPAVR
ncbi:MAG: hypothetical protein WC379_12150 [Methanoregula sp.]|jgi:hypothetical protein